MRLNRKPELLAPAGTLETAEAVIDAGADAVYLGGKQFNMRMHRSSYNLTEDEIVAAIAYAHARGRKVYYVLNNLTLDAELDATRALLRKLGQLRPDALIVQDLGVAALARELCVQLPLHASTMMNVHSTETANALKMMGFTRIIVSRDIPLHEVRRIGEESGLEMEYFLHGDICIAHSSQCYHSGIAFGESANRGRCMKSCLWKWHLVTEQGDVEFDGDTAGHLLARKDLCLFQHIPELVRNGIVSLKIEGRMRTAEFLSPFVASYRRAIDAYFENPYHYATSIREMNGLWDKRVRDYTTSHAFCNPGARSVDPTGEREPRLFSIEEPDPVLTVGNDDPPQPPNGELALIVHVSRAKAAEAAAEAGADGVYLGGDVFVDRCGEIAVGWLTEFVGRMTGRGIRVGVLGPRISDERDLAEWRWWLGRLQSVRPLTVGVSTLGALQVAKAMRARDILADFSLNATNSVAADELSTLGAGRVTASIELGFLQLAEFTERSRLPVEVIGHGPLPAMVLEHCVLASAGGDTPQAVCGMYCRRGRFALRDTSGQRHMVRTDRRCRNHIYMPSDVCVLPNLSRIAATGADALRIEAQFDSADAVSVVVDVYRRAIDALRSSEAIDADAGIAEIKSAAGRSLSDGPFAFDALPIMTKEPFHVG